MNEKELEAKLALIEASTSLNSLPKEALPPSHNEDYYFVSYSHKDYKAVLKDILRLEALGISIWYDADMHVGEKWDEIAQLYISKYQCRGIVFYLSENSISSPACNEEVAFALKHDKKFFSVNIPLDGRDLESGYAMLKELKKRGLKVSKEFEDNFSKAFGANSLYLSINETAEKKADAMISLPREPLLSFEIIDVKNSNSEHVLSYCHDISILSLDLDKEFTMDEEIDPFAIDEIAPAVFANYVKLEKINLPSSLKTISDFAFINCFSLEEIDLKGTKKIGKHAFANCLNLKKIDLSKVEEIGDYAFENCPNLELGPVFALYRCKLRIGAFS